MIQTISKPVPKLRQDNFLSIDPGVRTFGMAHFVDGVLTESNVIRKKNISEVIDEILFLMEVHQCPVAIEGQERQMGPAGWASYAKGNLFHLAYVTGAAVGFTTIYGLDAYIVLPSRWKGSLSKDQVKTRIRLVPGYEHVSLRDHEADAIGIGLWIMGRMP